jgi:Transposase DDE domain
MHESASTLIENWSGLVSRILGDLDIEQLARSTRALRRQRGVPNAKALLRLALARGPGGLSLRETAAWAHLARVAELTNASLNDRLHRSCEFLASIVASMLRAKTPGPCFRWPGRVLRISDGSCVSKPGSKGTDWRVHAVYDLGSGGFSHFELTDKHGAEALDRGAAIPGEIRLGDRNYSNAKGLRRYVDSVSSGGTADYVVRLRWSSLRLRDAEGRKFDLAAHLRDMPADQRTDDLTVSIEGAGAPMSTRIVILRKSEEAARAARERLLRQARNKGKIPDPRSLLAAEFVVLATSLPAGTYPADEIFAMYRLRWQIELAFKRLKSLLNLDRLPARTDKGARSWIYAHLILAIATDDHSQDILESCPEDLLDLQYAPSIWRVQKTVIWMLRMAIMGHIAIEYLKSAGARFHRLLAEPPRKRKKQVQYPLRALS